MPDLKTELTKLAPKLHALHQRCDDDPGGGGVSEAPEPPQATSAAERLWYAVRDNTNLTATQLAKRLDIPVGDIGTRLSAFYKRGLVTRSMNSDGTYTYAAVGTVYPTISKQDKIARMNAARAKRGTKSAKQAKPAKAVKPAKKPTTLAQPAVQPANITVRSLLDTLPVSVAAALYKELKQMFNGT